MGRATLHPAFWLLCLLLALASCGGDPDSGGPIGSGDDDSATDGTPELRWRPEPLGSWGRLDTDQQPHEPFGTVDDPRVIPVAGARFYWTDEGDTSTAVSDVFDVYPPTTIDESGPEIVYLLDLPWHASVDAWIEQPESEGVDVDLHLLSSLEPLELIDRGHYRVLASLVPGRYWLILDTYVDDGIELAGPYRLHVEVLRHHAGTLEDPLPLADDLSTLLAPNTVLTETRDTSLAVSHVFDSYPPNTLDQSGPELIYRFEVDQPLSFTAEIMAPEPAGVDVDLHLLSSVDPLVLVARSDRIVHQLLEPGTWWLVADSYAGGGSPRPGPYTLDVTVRPAQLAPEQTFNRWILAAVERLYQQYGVLGYDAAALTHDLAYGPHGSIVASAPPRTMCVAAVMEVLLTAMQIYAEETGRDDVWDHLPVGSWRSLRAGNIRAHLWVSDDIHSRGSADALRHFGIGTTVPFEQLTPGSVLNLNRTTGGGHAVIFLSFIDEHGRQSETWHHDVVGFRYFSSQGGYSAGNGGLDFRYAVFSEFGEPDMPYLRDLRIIRSDSQAVLNTGTMLHPDLWRPTSWQRGFTSKAAALPWVTFDAAYFHGVTADDVLK